MPQPEVEHIGAGDVGERADGGLRHVPRAPVRRVGRPRLAGMADPVRRVRVPHRPRARGVLAEAEVLAHRPSVRTKRTAPLAHVGEQRADLGEPGAQLGVADLDRAHRVLELHERLVGLGHGLHRALDESAHPLRRQPGRRRLERPAGEPVALGEAGVRAPRAAVRELDRPEELLLQPVAAVLVELLVRGAEGGERLAERVRRLRDGLEQLLSAPLWCRRPWDQRRPRSAASSAAGSIPSTRTSLSRPSSRRTRGWTRTRTSALNEAPP